MADLLGQGYESQIHTTVKYGFTDAAVDAVRAAVAGTGPIRCKLDLTTVFPPSKSSDGAAVVVVEVHSPGLRRLHGQLLAVDGAQPDTFPYHPHVTLAYVRPEVADQYADGDELQGEGFTIDHVQFITTTGKTFELPLEESTLAPAPAPIGKAAHPVLARGRRLRFSHAAVSRVNPEVQAATQRLEDRLTVELRRAGRAVSLALHRHLGKRRQPELAKGFNPDEPRDDTGKWTDGGVDSFLHEYESRTRPGQTPQERIHQSGGVSALERMGEQEPPPGLKRGEHEAYVRLVAATEPGTGQGHQALQELTDLADKHGVTLHLEAAPPPEMPQGLNQKQLIDWYGRHGFERVPHESWMTRPPSHPLGFQRTAHSTQDTAHSTQDTAIQRTDAQDTSALKEPVGRKKKRRGDAGLGSRGVWGGAETDPDPITKDYNPDEPRDDTGKWTDGGGTGTSAVNLARADEMWDEYGRGGAIKDASRRGGVSAGFSTTTGETLDQAGADEVNQASRHLQLAAENGTSRHHTLWRGEVYSGQEQAPVLVRGAVVRQDALTATSPLREVAEKYTDPQFIGNEGPGYAVLYRLTGEHQGYDRQRGDLGGAETILPKGATYRIGNVQPLEDRNGVMVDLYRPKGGVAGHKLAKADPPDLDPEELDQLVALAYDSIDWEGMVPDAEELLDQIARAGALSQLAELGITTPDLIARANAAAQAYAQDRAAELVGMRRAEDGSLIPNPDAYWAISDSTRDDLRDLIESAFADETPLAEMTAEIEDAGTFAPSRAELIAKTEAAKALVGGNLGVWSELGVPEVEVVLSEDHDQDDECNDVVAGNPYPLDQAPDVPIHPRCECALEAYLAE